MALAREARVELTANPDDENLCVWNIGAIGAKYYPGKRLGEERLEENDFGWLVNSLRCCKKLDIPLFNPLQITVFNLNDGFDFFKFASAQNPLQMIVVCNLHNSALPSGGLPYKTAMPDHKISTHHFEPSAWHDTSQITGAKYIMVATDGKTTVGPHHFEGPGYIAIPDPFWRGLIRQMNLLISKEIMPHIPKENLTDLKITTPQNYASLYM